MVTETSSGWVDGVQSRNTVRGDGSSTALSSALLAFSVSRSASSISTTCQRPPVGAPAARSTSARISSTEMDSPSGTTGADVGVGTGERGVALGAHRRSRPAGTAARRRTPARRPTDPSPGGPVKSQAWVIAPDASGVAAHDRAAAAAAAASSVATASSWPTRPAKTGGGHQWPVTGAVHVERPVGAPRGVAVATVRRRAVRASVGPVDARRGGGARTSSVTGGRAGTGRRAGRSARPSGSSDARPGRATSAAISLGRPDASTTR